MKKIVKKQIFKIEFELASALSIGSGDNDLTDRDIIRGSDEQPYIPASAIAGVCINAIDNKAISCEKKYRDYWGYIRKTNMVNDKSDALESSIIFHDACMIEGQRPEISIRDSVALDDYKTAKNGAKFDMEVLEPGIRFVTFIEQSFANNDEPELAKAAAKCFTEEELFFGAKTTRGYGAIRNAGVSEFTVKFDDNDPEEKKKLKLWACTSIENLNWEECDLSDANSIWTKSERVIRLRLKQQGGISIRRYTTEVPEKAGDTAPDFTQLVSTVGGSEIPTIPGTSWAGAFVHQMKKHLGGETDEEWKALFGFVSDQGKQRSRIRFSESQITGAESKQLSRSSIDRFSGGVANKALFTEKTYYGGNTELSIGISEDACLSDEMAGALAASILDLHYGFLSLGGETSIGRGLFSIEKIDGIDNIPDRNQIEKANEFYQNVFKLVKGNLKGGPSDVR